METKEIIGNDGVSIINNPFLPQCIDEISIRASRGLYDKKKMTFRGRVNFTNGNTEGSQKFEGNNLADVFNQVAQFCMNLKVN